ncbi:hypothetical protein OAL43_01470 [bacterium]|nr:hypothetical protein [bacterium]
MIKRPAKTNIDHTGQDQPARVNSLFQQGSSVLVGFTTLTPRPGKIFSRILMPWPTTRYAGQLQPKTGRLPILLLFISILAGPNPLVAQQQDNQTKPNQSTWTSQRSVAEQNLAAKEYDQAITRYQSVSQEVLSPKDQYNLGIALYREGDFDSAKAAFLKASGSVNRELAADARFNLANACYSEALEIVEQPASSGDAATTNPLQSLQFAITNYRSALQLRPSDQDARYNLELAAKLLQQLKEQEQEQEQEQDQPSQDQESEQDQSEETNSDSETDQENSEADSNPSDSQEQQPSGESRDPADSSEDPGSSENADTEDADPSEAASENNSESQSKQPEDTSQQSPESSNSDGSQTNNQQGEDSPSPAQTDGTEDQDATDPADENSDQTPEKSQAGNQPTAEDAGQGKADDDAMPESPDLGELSSDNAPTSDTESNENNAEMQPGVMSADEARKLLQSIRDRQMVRRLRLQQKNRAQVVPVQKDW